MSRTSFRLPGKVSCLRIIKDCKLAMNSKLAASPYPLTRARLKLQGGDNNETQNYRDGDHV